MRLLPSRRAMVPIKTVCANKNKRESGATLIEFSFVLLPTLGFMFLLIGLAWVIFAWGCVQEGVREAVRVAVTCPSGSINSSIQQTVEQYSFGFVNAGNIGTPSKGPLYVQYLDPGTLNPITTAQVQSGDVVKVWYNKLPVYTFAPILRSSGPLYVSASAADVMSCPTPGNP